MSQEEVDRGEGVIASAGMIFYRRNLGAIEVLTAIRQNEPWKGYTTIDFGGLVKRLDGAGRPSNMGVAFAAQREGDEETGEVFQFNVMRLVGIYGPQNFWHELSCRGQEIIATPTSTPISRSHFVHIMYAAEVASGKPIANTEMTNFEWKKPLDLASEGRKITFVGALILADFWHKISRHPSWRDPEMTSWIYTPRD